MGEQDVLQEERISAELRLKDLVKESVINWLEEVLTVCAIVTAVATMLWFGFS